MRLRVIRYEDARRQPKKVALEVSEEEEEEEEEEQSYFLFYFFYLKIKRF